MAQATILQKEVSLLRQSTVESKFSAQWRSHAKIRVSAAIMRIPEEIAFPSDHAGHPNATADLVEEKIREVLDRLAEPEHDPDLDDSDEGESADAEEPPPWTLDH